MSARLTGLDGAFLAFESPTVHLHVAGVMILDPRGMPTEVPGEGPFRRIRDHVASRVPLVPVLRTRVVEVPFGLAHAGVVDESEVDVDRHVRRACLPRPGGPAELATMVADLVSRPLDRRHPLWEMHVVEGLERGHVALVVKVHHAVIDGVSGVEVMADLLDLAPEHRTDPGAPPGGHGADRPRHRLPSPVVHELEVLRDAVRSLPEGLEAVARAVVETVRAARPPAPEAAEGAGPRVPSLGRAPRTSINGAISAQRRVALAELSMADVRVVREAFGGTVNDVSLAVVAGALRMLFDSRGELPERPLVAMVPVSLRTGADRGASGNRVSAVLVSLATDVEDQVERLRLIADGTATARRDRRIAGGELFAGWADALVPAVATRMSRLATNLRLFDHLPPACNVIVSNVPGPDVPLFLAGARMVAMYPFGPIVEGTGLNITFFSYEDTLYAGALGCRDLVPDVDVVARGMVDALGDLVKEATRRRPSGDRRRPSRTDGPPV